MGFENRNITVRGRVSFNKNCVVVLSKRIPLKKCFKGGFVTLLKVKLSNTEKRLNTDLQNFILSTNYTGMAVIEKHHQNCKDLRYIKFEQGEFTYSFVDSTGVLEDEKACKRAIKLLPDFKVIIQALNKNDFNAFDIEITFQILFQWQYHYLWHYMPTKLAVLPRKEFNDLRKIIRLAEMMKRLLKRCKYKH